jgi:hypothetical protein
MWRRIAIGLLAANLLFLAWSRWIATPPTAARVLTTPAVAVAAVPPPPPPRCVSLGPFADPAAAATVAQRLADLQLAPQTRDERQQHRDGYWVVIATADAAEQRRVLTQLRRVGIQDAYAMPADERFRISLGIYTDRERAVQRAASLAPLRFEPVVEEHFQERAVRWLDVPGAGEQVSASRLESLGITDAEVGAFDCPNP